MKYRIKITTFKTGRKEYRSYVKKGLFWRPLWHDGFISIEAYTCDTHETALRIIDSHYAGNSKILKNKFKYINK
jgi:hypothetical protein